MKFILLFVIFFFNGGANAGVIERDKMLHFGVSTAMAMVMSSSDRADEYKFEACLVVGLAKEVYDEFDYGGFSVGDLVWDAVGCALGGYVGDNYIRRLQFEGVTGDSESGFGLVIPFDL